MILPVFGKYGSAGFIRARITALHGSLQESGISRLHLVDGFRIVVRGKRDLQTVSFLRKYRWETK